MMELQRLHERCERVHLHMILRDIWSQISSRRHDIRLVDGKMIAEQFMKTRRKYGTGLL